MPTALPLLLCTLMAVATSALASDSLFPFVLPWDDATASATDLSGRLEKPAGRRGFVGVRDGRLALGGKRVRFFGVNLCFGACFPKHEDADKVAARLAKLGINCVRFHHMDTQHAPDGLLRADRRTLDPAMLDRLDYFVAALKERGIYVNLNLHVGRLYPGMPLWPGMPQYFKGIDQFHPPMIASQKEFARTLLTHVNPYTGTAYAEEPAIAFVEINNENSLIDQWWKGALDTLPEPYAGELRERWREWLEKETGSPEAAATMMREGGEPPGEEMLTAAEDNNGGWVLEQHGDARATLNVNPRIGWRVGVERPGKEAWHVQLNRPGLSLKGGKPYTFTFQARAATPRRLTVALGQSQPPWNILWSAPIETGPEWRKYSLILTPGPNDEEARIGFTNLGEEAGVFQLARPSFRRGSLPPPASAAAETTVGGETPGPGLVLKRDFAGLGEPSQRAWVRFLWEQERAYWHEMARFLREDLKVASLLIGTQVGFSPLPLQAELDVVDVHGYWQHPLFPRQEWDPENWTVHNLPMAGAPGAGALGPMAMMRAAGKPYICTEYSHPAPNSYGSESLPLIGAFAALQDWDAVFAFAYSHRRDDWNARRIAGFFDIDQHPAKLATLPAAVHLFCRGDLLTPERGSVVTASLEQALERVRLAGPGLSADHFGLSPEAIFSGPVAMAFGKTSGRSASKATAPAPGFRWETGAGDVPGRVVIDTPKTKGVIGHGVGQKFALDGLAITPEASTQGWSAILVTELEHMPLPWKRSRHYLVTATGRCENTEMQWKDKAHSSVGTRWGKTPTLVEGIAATLEFPAESTLKAWALDERGERREEIPAKAGVLRIGPEFRTLWYEVEVH